MTEFNTTRTPDEARIILTYGIEVPNNFIAALGAPADCWNWIGDKIKTMTDQDCVVAAEAMLDLAEDPEAEYKAAMEWFQQQKEDSKMTEATETQSAPVLPQVGSEAVVALQGLRAEIVKAIESNAAEKLQDAEGLAPKEAAYHHVLSLIDQRIETPRKLADGFYAQFDEFVRKHYKSKMENALQVLEQATPQQLAELNGLVALWAGKAAEIPTSAGPSALDEVKQAFRAQYTASAFGIGNMEVMDALQTRDNFYDTVFDILNDATDEQGQPARELEYFKLALETLLQTR